MAIPMNKHSTIRAMVTQPRHSGAASRWVSRYAVAIPVSPPGAAPGLGRVVGWWLPIRHCGHVRAGRRVPPTSGPAASLTG